MAADTTLFFPVLPELKDFVSRQMLFRHSFDPKGLKKVYPYPPRPQHSLIFYPKDRLICKNYFNGATYNVPHTIIVGPQVKRIDLTMGYDVLVILIDFTPGSLHRLLGIPMHEMIGLPFDASLLLGREIEELNEKISDAKEYNQMMQLVQSYLLTKVKKLKSILPIDRVLDNLIFKGQWINVNELSQQACVSVRQLERQFKERIGLPPKLYSRLVRLSTAWIIREKNPHLTWSQIAHYCNYADQMHMIREFKEFTDEAPSFLQATLEKTDLRLQSEVHN